MENQDWRDALKGLALAQTEVESEELLSNEVADESRGRKTPVHIALERKGRGGKTATIIYDLTIGDDELKELAADLKRSLGCGGSARGGEILIQGDRVADCRSFLEKRGFKVK